jgi:hypothetical protein
MTLKLAPLANPGPIGISIKDRTGKFCTVLSTDPLAVPGYFFIDKL